MAKKDRYPSPCDSCEKNNTRCIGCEDWKIRYRYRQKQINAFAKKLFSRGEKGRESFCYSHPDQVRRYVGTHPCKGCGLEKDCDTPCGRYLHWYDLRVEIARKKVGL